MVEGQTLERGSRSRAGFVTTRPAEVAERHAPQYVRPMTRRPRLWLPSYGTYHMTTRGVDRMPIVEDDFDRRRWVSLRRDAFGRFEIATYAWCLMTNHYHAIVEGSLTDISRALQRLNGVYAQRFNARHVRTGHLYEQRPDIRLVADDEHFENGCDYVRANPVRAGLCMRAGDWPWAGSDF